MSGSSLRGSRRRSRPSLVALALSVVAGLASCARAPSAADPTLLRFLTWKPDQPAVWDEAIRRFEAAHPRIRVVREVAPHSSTALHDVLVQKLRNRDPDLDVFFVDVVWPAELAAAGWAAPLERWFPTEELRAFLPAAIAAASWHGSVWAIPAFVDVGLLYYRRDLLERHGRRVPETWEELDETARAIVAAEGRDDLLGYSGQFKQYEGIVCDLLELVAANGGRLLDDAGRPALHESPTLGAVAWARDRLIHGIASPNQLTYQEPESLAVFLQGLAVFHRNWPYAWQVANDPRESRVAGRVGVSPLPRFAGGTSASALGGWLYAVSPFSRHPEAAVEFVRFMASAEIERLLAIEASIAPARTVLYDDPAVLAKNPHFRDAAAAFRSPVPRPATPLYPAVSSSLQRFFSAALADPRSDLPTLAADASSTIAADLAEASR